jgi:hypothetical protein
MTGQPGLTSGLVGMAGVYLVAAELSQRGVITSLTSRNTRGIDILASSADASRQVGIQVKTAQRGTGWILGAKDERYAAPNLFYVFVALAGQDGRPEFYVVSSRKVAASIRRSHSRWLATPGRHGQKHRDSAIRKFWDRRQHFLNNWDGLGL